MKKSKIFAVVLSIIMAFAMFAVVGCGDKEEEPTPATQYTVVFKDGDTEVKKVTVNAGAVLTAEDVPAGPTKEGQIFVGWFNGETEIKAGVAINADITATAKYNTNQETAFTVTFKVGETTVKTATVKEGEKVAAADVPADPEEDNHVFGGWFIDGDSDKPFDPSADNVTADITVIADMVKTANAVKFYNGTTEVKSASVAIGGKLTSADIPGAVTGSDGEVFLGWYAGTTKAEANLGVADDMTFYATFVKEADYTGAWYNDEDAVMAIFGADSKVTVLDVKDTTFTYSDGKMTYSKGSYLSAKTYTLTVIGDKMTVDFKEWDDIEEDFVTTTYTLTKGEAVEFAGEYRKSKTEAFTIYDGGLVVGSGAYYARAYVDGADVKMVYRETESAANQILPVEVDGEGNVILDGGIYVKDATEFAQYTGKVSDTYVYLYVFTVDSEKVYVYNNGETSGYATIESGTIELNGIVTVKIGEKQIIAKITKLAAGLTEGNMQVAGAERGRYSIKSQSSYSIVLDGFGTAQKMYGYIGSEEQEWTGDYHMVGASTVVLVKNLENAEFEGYDLTNMGSISGGQAAVVAEFALKGKYQSQKQYYSDHYVYFDGYGGVIDKRGSYSYLGEYDLDWDAQTVTITTPSSYLANGTYTIEQNGDVIVSADGKTWYLKDGATVTTHIDDFVGANAGWWQNDADETEYVTFDKTNGKIKIGTKNYSYTANWNGTQLSFGTYPIYYTATIVGGKLNISDGTNTKTYTSVPEPVVELDGFEGVYIAKDGTKWILVEVDGKGGAKYNGTAYDYTKESADKIMLGDDAFGYELNVTTMKVQKYYDYMESGSAFSVINLYGTWKDSDHTFIVNIDGTAEYDGSSAVYSFTQSSGFELYCDYYYHTVKEVTATSISLYVADDYDEDTFTLTLTKQEEAALDAFAGTWTTTGFTVVFNGDGTGKWDNTYDFTYTVSGNVATLSDIGPWTDGGNKATLEANGSLTVNLYGDYGDNNVTKTFTKQ